MRLDNYIQNYIEKMKISYPPGRRFISIMQKIRKHYSIGLHGKYPLMTFAAAAELTLVLSLRL